MNARFETICILGLGYIGLPTAAVFASRKLKVIGVDINQHAVDTINRGEIHIVEPDLDIVVQAAVQAGYLRAATVPERADAFLITVPTPFKEGPGTNHEPDLSYIEAAVQAIAPVLQPGNLVVLESTSPVGATEKVAEWLQELRPDLSFPQTASEQADVMVAHCPERVLPGRILQELVQNDRVIGGMTPRCSRAARDLYGVFVQGECVITNARTAEMCKLTENSYRDVNIAFANELSILCDRLDVNVWELIRLANLHPRVDILQPGPGVGGHCIAVDPWFIVSSAPEHARLIRTGREVNGSKPDWVVEKVLQKIAEHCSDGGQGGSAPRIACYGLAFKPDIDDLRESPAVQIAMQIAERGVGEVWAVEPNIQSLPARIERQLSLVDLDTALNGADVHVILVDHREFRARATEFQSRTVVDTRGICNGL